MLGRKPRATSRTLDGGRVRSTPLVCHPRGSEDNIRSRLPRTLGRGRALSTLGYASSVSVRKLRMELAAENARWRQSSTLYALLPFLTRLFRIADSNRRKRSSLEWILRRFYSSSFIRRIFGNDRIPLSGGREYQEATLAAV